MANAALLKCLCLYLRSEPAAVVVQMAKAGENKLFMSEILNELIQFQVRFVYKFDYNTRLFQGPEYRHCNGVCRACVNLNLGDC
jgi:hypothetical protein